MPEIFVPKKKASFGERLLGGLGPLGTLVGAGLSLVPGLQPAGAAVTAASVAAQLGKGAQAAAREKKDVQAISAPPSDNALGRRVSMRRNDSFEILRDAVYSLPDVDQEVRVAHGPTLLRAYGAMLDERARRGVV